MNINQQLSEATKQYGIGSNTNYFRFQKGENRIRILTAGEIIATHFFGKGVKPSTCYGEDKGCPFHGENAPKDENGKEKKLAIKYSCYVLNVKEGIIQLADLPYSVIKQIGEYQNNVDYSFDSFPMPYDVTITFDPDSKSPVNMYKIIASPKREEVSDEIKGKLAEVLQELSPAEHIQKKKNYQIKDHQEQGIWVNPQEKETKRVADYKEAVSKMPRADKVEYENSVPYPEEDIKPEDIPF
mgnify:CR=1 FL=1